MNKKVIWVVLVFALILVAIFFGIFSYKTGFAVKEIDSNYLGILKQNAEAECLQNSQCFENSECLDNQCVDKSDIDVCKKVNLYTPTMKLKLGDSIDSVKKVLTKNQLPALLSGGELVEIIDGKPIQYFYNSIILMGDNEIKKSDKDYLIENNKPLYIYKIIFSRPIDFLNKNLQGQVLRILGKEYFIGSNSDNSNIYLVSKDKNIVLQNNKNTIIKNEGSGILEIDINFYSLNNLNYNQDFSESKFDAIKFSFDSVDIYNGFADVSIGGNCL